MATTRRALRAGDIVEVRPAAEILATLDDNAELDSVPFMPEMLRFVGGRFRVASRALKVCSPAGNTHLNGVVFLEQLRCDGSEHGGCEAECRLYWKEEWLRPVKADEPAAIRPAPDGGALEERTRSKVKWLRTIDSEPEEVFHCQATEAARAGTVVSWHQPTQYLRELSSRNVGPWHFVRVMTRAVVHYVGLKLRLVGFFPVKPAGLDRVDGEDLGLQPGDWVEIRPMEEIARTLDEKLSHRGLGFHYEMVQHAGRRYRVRRRLNRIIDEANGRMIEMRRDLIALEGLICTGDRAWTLWFCRRELYPYWREAWLRRVDGPAHVVTVPPVAAPAASGNDEISDSRQVD